MLEKIVITLTAGCLLAAGPVLADSEKTVDEHRQGYSVGHNLEVQLLNPDAGSEDPVPTTLDGPKGENILEDYRSEQQAAETEGMIQDVGGE